MSAPIDNANPYDEILYPGYPFPQTHPDRLATLATLFGMKPAPVESSRVLELGCGDGANLIPMAFGLPGSEFVGIDLTGQPIAKGMDLIRELGLTNITLDRCDVMEVSDDFGRFDYIIAHGLYSWVVPAAQDKILSVCKRNLAPRGVAYISYNTHPGGHLRQMIREMMLFHVRDVTEPQERVSQARGLIKSLSEWPAESDAYKAFLKNELDRVLRSTDESLYHDDLAEINAPVYFYQFMEHAARHGLQYLTEAEQHESQTSIFPPLVTEEWKKLGYDLMAQEQYLDFLKYRMFRQTLLCHRDIVLDRPVRPEQMKKFYLASSARPVSPKPDVVSPSVVEEFRASNGVTLSTDGPLAKAAILYLGEIWPQAVTFDELQRGAHTLLGEDQDQDEPSPDQKVVQLCEVLLKTYGWNLVELHVHQPRFALTASEQPKVSPLARLQARHETILTTLRHTVIEVKDGLARHLLMLLDGTRDRAALVRELAQAVESGRATTHIDSAEPNTQEPPFEISFEELEQKLSELARLALLVA